MTHLILVRHGTSVWNKEGKWTGWTDIDLAEEGVAEATSVGHLLRDIPLHRAHVSALKRAQQTLQHILTAHGTSDLPTTVSPALNERHYGVHTGKNKWEVKTAVGDDVFQQIRRSWDFPIPEGESLKEVHARVVPHYESIIARDVTAGHNTLVVAHGNSLRALKKHLEGIADTAIADVEIGHTEAHCYVFQHDTLYDRFVRSLPVS